MSTSTPLIVLKRLIGNDPTQFNTLQQFLLPYADILALAWLAIWGFTCLVLIVRLVREYQKQRTDKP